MRVCAVGNARARPATATTAHHDFFVLLRALMRCQGGSDPQLAQLALRRSNRLF